MKRPRIFRNEAVNKSIPVPNLKHIILSKTSNMMPLPMRSEDMAFGLSKVEEPGGAKKQEWKRSESTSLPHMGDAWD